jgi:hypothetical protein
MQSKHSFVTATVAIAAVLLLAGECIGAEPITEATNFCKAGKGFGVKFGSPEGKGQHLSVTSALVELPPAYKPFNSAEVVVTLRQRRTHTVHGQADFDNPGDATVARVQIRGALLAEGWLAQESRESPSGELLYSGRDALDADKPKGLVADLFTLGSRLYFSCSDAALARQARLELPPPPTNPPRQP